MLTTRKHLLTLMAAAALGSLASSALAVETRAEKEAIQLRNLARLDETAATRADFEQIARLYELRAEWLDEKVARHERLEKRFAAAPASLIAKRGTAWNTPKRQRRLAHTARDQAAAARELAGEYRERAASAPIAAD